MKILRLPGRSISKPILGFRKSYIPRFSHSLERRNEDTARQVRDAMRAIRPLMNERREWAKEVVETSLEKAFLSKAQSKTLTLEQVLKSFGLKHRDFSHLILYGTKGYDFDEKLEPLLECAKSLFPDIHEELDLYTIDMVIEAYEMETTQLVRVGHERLQAYCTTARWLHEFGTAYREKRRTPNLTGRIPFFERENKAEIHGIDQVLEMLKKLKEDWDENKTLYPPYKK